jgi:hypothetical protein
MSNTEIPGGLYQPMAPPEQVQSPGPIPEAAAPVMAPPFVAPVKKKSTGGGRPKGSKNKDKGAQQAWRPSVHEQMHQTMRPDPIRTRIRHTGGKLDIPLELLERHLPGRSVEWKRNTVLGQADPIYEIELKEAGWWPVQSSQLPGLMPEGYRGPVIRESMMLYERPMELTLQAKAEQQKEAVEVIRVTERRLGLAGPGEMERDHPKVRPRVNTEYMPLAPRAPEAD